ncbi:monovalent cation:H+ antiporter, CPA1 family [Ferrimonas sediminum]|uniref:Monovalent cation:H+ antiporter, CPA1 family n=1 Tax=Ferrimonas sediminum TaxID=718193 RepID=A0A1G8NRT9_9GAMM|nr:hypothetical protein [Ferrimonas sediminum]SDI82210.1 monovalent cation:H+ antiporter, CPA1 family [Ferrimonas sediminum]
MESSWLLGLGAITLVVAAARLELLVRHPLLLLLGVVVGQAVTGFGWQTGVTAADLARGIYFLLLPWLMVQGALHLSRRRLSRLWPWVIVPSSLVFAVTVTVVALILYFSIDHPGFPLLSAVIAGVLLAAADPSWSSLLIPQKRGLLVLLEGEGLWGEMLAVVGLMLLTTAGSLQQLQPLSLSLGFFWLMLASLVLAWCAHWLMRPLLSRAPRLLLPLSYLLFWGAEWGFGLSGVVTTAVAVLLLSPRIDAASRPFIAEGGRMWADVLVLVLGFSLTLSMFTERYWVMGMAIVACLGARVLVLALIALIPSLPLVTDSRRLWWRLPVHGPVTLALVLSLPVSVTAWWTIQSACYGVILFELLIQRPWVARGLLAR